MLESLGSHEVAPLALAAEAPGIDVPVVSRPEERAELEGVQADLLAELAGQGLGVALARVDAAARRRPPGAHRVLEAHEEDPIGGIEHQRADSGPLRQPRTRAASSKNQSTRSNHGTAAFAGDVEGSTKSRVSPSVRSWTPSSGRSLNAPR